MKPVVPATDCVGILDENLSYLLFLKIETMMTKDAFDLVDSRSKEQMTKALLSIKQVILEFGV